MSSGRIRRFSSRVVNRLLSLFGLTVRRKSTFDRLTAELDGYNRAYVAVATQLAYAFKPETEYAEAAQPAVAAPPPEVAAPAEVVPSVDGDFAQLSEDRCYDGYKLYAETFLRR